MHTLAFLGLLELPFCLPDLILITDLSCSTWIRPERMYSTTQKPSDPEVKEPSRVCRLTQRYTVTI